MNGLEIALTFAICIGTGVVVLGLVTQAWYELAISLAITAVVGTTYLTHLGPR